MLGQNEITSHTEVLMQVRTFSRVPSAVVLWFVCWLQVTWLGDRQL